MRDSLRETPTRASGGTPRPAGLDTLAASSLNPGNSAFFLDFDGTLADIVDNPQAVAITADIHAALSRIHAATDGATAIVTGRPIREIDTFLEPLKLPVAGVHGLERRGSDGVVATAAIDEAVLESLRVQLSSFADGEPGLLLEVKTGSMALHYRRRPELEQLCIETVERVTAGLSGIEILRGKMVVEVKGGRMTKGDAVAAFMDEEIFRGRRPVFAGDDVTDEDAFREVERLNGISIKVGTGDTAAAYRAADIVQFHNWLLETASAFGRRSLTE